MPLLRGVARVAVISGTATAVRTASRAARRTAGPRRTRAKSKNIRHPRRSAAPAADPLDQLKQLGELKASGVLTDAEFEAQKAKILQGVN